MYVALSHSCHILGIGRDPDDAIADATCPTNHEQVRWIVIASRDVVACYSADVDEVRVRVVGGVAVLA